MHNCLCIYINLKLFLYTVSLFIVFFELPSLSIPFLFVQYKESDMECPTWHIVNSTTYSRPRVSLYYFVLLQLYMIDLMYSLYGFIKINDLLRVFGSI